MNFLTPEGVSGDRVAMKLTHPKHMNPDPAYYSGIGKRVLDLEKATGAGMLTRAGTFEEAMLNALDRVSGDQQFASQLNQRAITEPGSVDIHDLTIAQAKATMSLDISRNILSRLVQGWRDIINTR
ncbi:MAG: flagellar hook-basal body complex protein FliE [Treponema sp.]|jgi:flagellar hook-basal body complex protein FliE|nr:flagellar hook-basal body complex protein FliE [Treponema sp.]